MTPNNTLRLDNLSLRNFRCFAELTIALHPELTVLVAENGRGKTAVLDAIKIALGLFVDTIAKTQQAHGFDRTDARLVLSEGGAMTPTLPTEFVADGEVAGQTIHWSRALVTLNDRTRAKTSFKKAEDFRRTAQKIRDSVIDDLAEKDVAPVTLPLVAFYGTGRLWSEHRLTEGKKKYDLTPDDRFSAYTDCLSSSSSFKGVVAWFERKVREIGDPAFATELSRNIPLLRAVQEATQVVLEPTGWRELNWDEASTSLSAEHPNQGRLPLSALSDGVRNMIALVADIAHRCARLNPHFRENAARLTPGILLIDEVDMHLHPGWQQQVIELLRKAFPAMQIVLSTHSPHVLSTVYVNSIRVIRFHDGKGLIETPQFQTRGVESADVLATIMGVDPVPQVEEAKWLSDYRAIIEDGDLDSAEAQTLLSRLIDHFGSNHPLMLDCERLIRFQSFKRRRAS